MKKLNYLLIVILVIMSITISCRRGFFCESGFGDLSSENRTVNEFNRIDLKVAGTIYLLQGDTQNVTVIGQDNILKILDTKVVNQELVIDFSECASNYEDIKIYVTIKNYKALKISGSGSIISEDSLFSEEIDLNITGSGSIDLKNVEFEKIISKISGSGNILLKGINTQHDIQITGSGDLESYELESENINIELDGTGNIYVWAVSTLNIKILGSGSVYYKGFPEINTEILGSGKIISSN